MCGNWCIQAGTERFHNSLFHSKLVIRHDPGNALPPQVVKAGMQDLSAEVYSKLLLRLKHMFGWPDTSASGASQPLRHLSTQTDYMLPAHIMTEPGAQCDNMSHHSIQQFSAVLKDAQEGCQPLSATAMTLCKQLQVMRPACPLSSWCIALLGQ